MKFFKYPFILAFLSFVFYRIALPPYGAWAISFLAPCCWFFLYDLPAPPPVKRFRIFPSFYEQVWCAAVLFWLAVNFWISFPHPATSLGLIALSFYLALFFPLFLFLVRSLIRKDSLLSLLVVPPIAWCAVEWLRKHLLGGFSFASLEHSFYREPFWIQSADLFGEYTVGMFIVLAGTLIGLFAKRIMQKERKCFSCICPVLVLALLIGLHLYYGKYRMDQIARSADHERAPFTVALLQDNTLFSFPVPEKTNLAICEKYRSLNRTALLSSKSPDLIVWPESCFVNPGIVLSSDSKSGGKDQPGMEKMNELREKIRRAEQEEIKDLVPSQGTLLLGRGTVEFLTPQKMIFYNSAYFISSNSISQGKDPVRYDKIQRVMFGEYIPFAEYLPDSFPLKTLCNSVQAGKKSVLFSLARDKDPIPVRILPNICFESSIPHLIQKQCREWSEQGKSPDILLNISNDGWFKNSWQIDLHLATHVFRAAENRKIVLSATHAGLSAAILPNGSIKAEGTRGTAQIVNAELHFHKFDRNFPLLPEFPIVALLLIGGAMLIKFRIFCRKRKNQTEETPEG
ncbi:MAG: apolipoprotein N-acyltransferase [Planctomycetia bacterium]|nr:apolipoprotein N-acyltransferase [Planctomycetia bacterium]